MTRYKLSNFANQLNYLFRDLLDSDGNPVVNVRTWHRYIEFNVQSHRATFSLEAGNLIHRSGGKAEDTIGIEYFKELIAEQKELKRRK